MSSIDNMSEIQAKQALQKEEIVCKSVKGKLWATGKELQRTQTTLDLSLNMLFARVTDQDEAMELANQLELYIEADTGNRGWIDTYTNKRGRESYAHYMGIPTEPKYCGPAKLGDAVKIYTDQVQVGRINDYISAWEYDPTPKLWSQKFKPVLTHNARFLTKLTLYVSYKSRGEPSPAYWNGAVEQFNLWKRGEEWGMPDVVEVVPKKKKVLPKKKKQQLAIASDDYEQPC
tara:strand:+ start:58 stop:750 length:693 start_codon:yes stop_codon:yes gene_type:complete